MSYIELKNKSSFPTSKFLSLSLNLGEFSPFVEAQTSVAHTLADRLELTLECRKSTSWIALQTDQDNVVSFCQPKLPPASSNDQCINNRLVEMPGDFRISPFQSSLLCIIHGDLDSDHFHTLFQFAKAKYSTTHTILLRLLAKTEQQNPSVSLGGFSVSLDIKNVEYASAPKTKATEQEWESGLNFETLISRVPENTDSLHHLKLSLKSNREKLKAWEIGDISIQLALHVLTHPTGDRLLELAKVVQNLPTFVRTLAKVPVSMEHVELARARLGSTTQLFLNNVEILPGTSVQDLISTVRNEDRVLELMKANPKCVPILKQVSGDGWGARVDLRKFAKGAVHFLNDIEKDHQYRTLSASLQQLSEVAGGGGLAPVRRNLFTAVMVLGTPQLEWLAVVRYFIRMGAPIRFGFVIPVLDTTCDEAKEHCHPACVARLYMAAKMEHGLEPALTFLQSLATTCEEHPVRPMFVKSLKDSTRSWSSSGFEELANKALKMEIPEVEAYVEKSNRYVKELGLPPGALLFNGLMLTVDAVNRIDRVLQNSVFQEQARLVAHLGQFDEREDILAQVLVMARAQPKLSRFMDQKSYLDPFTPLPQDVKYVKPEEALGVLTVWTKSQVVAELFNDVPGVRVGLTNDLPVTLVVNGRLIESPVELFTKDEVLELVTSEQARLQSTVALTGTFTPEEYLACSLFLSLGRGGGRAPPPEVDPFDEFTVVTERTEAQRGQTRHQLVFVINPLDANTPVLSAMAVWISETYDLDTSLVFRPEPDVSALPISSFFRWSGPQSSVVFEDDLVPQDQVLTLKVHASHPSWIVFPLRVTDPDNLVLRNENVVAQYQVSHVIISGECLKRQGNEPASGALVELAVDSGLELASVDDFVLADSLVMYNLAYWQMKAKPGYFIVRANEGEENKFTFPPKRVGYTSFGGPGHVQLKASLTPVKHTNEVVANEDDDVMHVFSLASGAMYERLLRIMLLSVRKRSSGRICFWLLENYMSREMKAFLPGFAKKHNFTVKLVTYKWPEWLRGQSELQRQIWGMKILFLDVLFPLSVKRIIFVDADQVLRADLRELWNLNLRGAPYAMTPFCDSRKETLGFQFWRQGYWASHLRGKNYHISALFVVDLAKFRRESVGDRLRAVYQQLSSDPNSLSNLDQDLPNFAQHEIEIFSLPQEWLWCESWCSDESKSKSKTIDLCNNPLFKEPKLDMAKRVIKGDLFKESWEELDAEVGFTQS